MHVMTLLPIIQAAAGDEGLSIAEVLADIPHDAASIVIYALIVVSVGFVIRAGRQKKEPAEGGDV